MSPLLPEDALDVRLNYILFFLNVAQARCEPTSSQRCTGRQAGAATRHSVTWLQLLIVAPPPNPDYSPPPVILLSSSCPPPVILPSSSCHPIVIHFWNIGTLCLLHHPHYSASRTWPPPPWAPSSAPTPCPRSSPPGRRSPPPSSR